MGFSKFVNKFIKNTNSKSDQKKLSELKDFLERIEKFQTNSLTLEELTIVNEDFSLQGTDQKKKYPNLTPEAKEKIKKYRQPLSEEDKSFAKQYTNIDPQYFDLKKPELGDEERYNYQQGLAIRQLKEAQKTIIERSPAIQDFNQKIDSFKEQLVALQKINEQAKKIIENPKNQQGQKNRAQENKVYAEEAQHLFKTDPTVRKVIKKTFNKPDLSNLVDEEKSQDFVEKKLQEIKSKLDGLQQEKDKMIQTSMTSGKLPPEPRQSQTR